MRARPKAGRRHRGRAVRTAVVLSTAAALIAALPVGANAAPEPKAPSGAAQGWTGGKTGSGGSTRQPALPEEQRAAVLGKSYTTSDDLAWSTSGDATGFHLLTAARADGYAWRTAATLAEPGFEADSWIGNVCVTGSGKRAVVAYAPRTFTNDQQLMSRGAFTAVVELATGKVTKLPFQASLAYFSPGCGTDETAVFSQFADDRSARNETRVVRVDAATGKAAEPLALAGQVTSAVPYGDDVVAADGNRLVRIDGKGARSTVALTRRIPFQLKADRDGGLVYLDRPAVSPSARTKAAAAEDGAVMRVDATAVKSGKGAPSKLATGTLAKMDLTSSADGTVMVTGETRQAVSALPAAVRRPAGAPKDAHASTDGKVLVTAAGWSGDGKNPARAGDTGAERTAMIDLKDLGTGRTAALETRPGGAPHQDAGQKLSPSLEGVGSTAAGKRSASLAAAGDPHNPVEAERTCAVARGDVRQQAFQPTPRQVEWAVDQAISNNLNKLVSRPANWKDTGVGSYAPQQLFPLKSLTGGGQIPAQVMLGITAQESNMWQATRYAVPGVTANSLIGNYYGTKYNSDGQIPDPWAIDWSESDCGYGITQVTDNMRASDTGWSSLQQKAVAVDYTANIAAGVNILIEKWNQTKAGGMTIANGDPKYLESWFFALWAYNSGFYPEADASKNKGKWGLGFTNNPANPLWKANRTPFLENASGTDDYSHAAHPQDWPYQEKVLGWAARPISALFKPGDMQAGYRPAWWTTIGDRTALKPPESLFCTSANECDPSKIGPNDSNDPGMGRLHPQRPVLLVEQVDPGDHLEELRRRGLRQRDPPVRQHLSRTAGRELLRATLLGRGPERRPGRRRRTERHPAVRVGQPLPVGGVLRGQLRVHLRRFGRLLPGQDRPAPDRSRLQQPLLVHPQPQDRHHRRQPPQHHGHLEAGQGAQRLVPGDGAHPRPRGAHPAGQVRDRHRLRLVHPHPVRQPEDQGQHLGLAGRVQHERHTPGPPRQPDRGRGRQRGRGLGRGGLSAAAGQAEAHRGRPRRLLHLG
ncbi:hypothetical protein OKW18_005098 [Streptomyces pratensis]|nr:hypothetical protein [Streptomyces pratensis]